MRAFTWLRLGSSVLFTALLTACGPDEAGLEPPILVARATRVDFGALPLGNTSARPLYLENGGAETLVLERLVLEGEGAAVFRVAEAPASLEAGREGMVRLEFTPAAATSYAATLRFESNAPAGGEVTVSVTGRGL